MRLRGFLEIFTTDLQTKALALAGAIVLWVVVTFLGSRTVTVDNIPVSVVNLPADLGLSEDLPAVAVHLRIPRTLALEEDPQRLVRTFVDLEGSGLGGRTVPVTVTATTPTVDVLSVQPASIRVTLDPVVERTVPVRVVPTGTPKEGYRIGDVRAEPERVRVRAALGVLERASEIDADVSAEGATASFDSEAPLRLPPGAQATPDRVRVFVAIEQAQVTKTVGVRVLTKGTPGAGYWVRTISTDPVAVTVKGAREVMDPLSSLDTVSVDIAGAQSSVDTAVDLLLPEGTEVVTGEKRVRVHVDVAPLQGTKEVAASASAADVPDGLRVASVSPVTLRVSVRGEGEAFDALRDEDVRVVVSVAGREQGTVTLRPSLDNVRTPSSIRAISIEARDVTIQLESS